ncbi:hypothetical protein AZE42_12423, partial [Rhizopogon vesiculosus]
MPLTPYQFQGLRGPPPANRLAMAITIAQIRDSNN